MLSTQVDFLCLQEPCEALFLIWELHNYNGSQNGWHPSFHSSSSNVLQNYIPLCTDMKHWFYYHYRWVKWNLVKLLKMDIEKWTSNIFNYWRMNFVSFYYMGTFSCTFSISLYYIFNFLLSFLFACNMIPIPKINIFFYSTASPCLWVWAHYVYLHWNALFCYDTGNKILFGFIYGNGSSSKCLQGS